MKTKDPYLRDAAGIATFFLVLFAYVLAMNFLIEATFGYPDYKPMRFLVGALIGLTGYMCANLAGNKVIKR